MRDMDAMLRRLPPLTVEAVFPGGVLAVVERDWRVGLLLPPCGEAQGHLLDAVEAKLGLSDDWCIVEHEYCGQVEAVHYMPSSAPWRERLAALPN